MMLIIKGGPFVGGGESGEWALKAWNTLQEYKVVGCCLPTPRYGTPSSIAGESLYLVMLSPSPGSGTLCLCWRRWSLQGELSTVDRFSRSPPCGWRTSRGYALTPPGAPTHLLGEPGPDHCRRCHLVLLKHRHPAPHQGPTRSRSSRWRRLQTPSAADQPSRGSTTPRSSSSAPLNPALSAPATLHHHESQHLLLHEPPCSNKLLGGKTKPNQKTVVIIIKRVGGNFRRS